MRRIMAAFSRLPAGWDALSLRRACILRSGCTPFEDSGRATQGLSLPIRDRLGTVEVLVLLLCLRRVHLAQEIRRRGDVVPAAVLEIDHRLAVVVDRDDPPDGVD